jgi:hypothetical protein
VNRDADKNSKNQNLSNNENQLIVNRDADKNSKNQNLSNNENQLIVNPDTDVKSKGDNSQVIDNQINTIKPKEISPLQASNLMTLDKYLHIQNKPSKQTFSRWAIQVTLAPDLSMVGKIKGFKIGQNFGLSTEFQAFKNFSVMTGAYYSNKVYLADPDEYKPYPGIWQIVPKPEEIDATCRVLEVPLNLRFYAINLPKNRIFLSSGISSYWMLNERYKYNYNNAYYPSRTKELNNANKHLWSILNFSIGWEKSITAHWRMQVEPFVKAPLGDVGYGKVRLLSTGAFLNFKYQF